MYENLNSVEREAPTIEEAKEQIAQALGVSVKEIDFEVVQEPGKKKFGLFGGTNAILKGTIRREVSASAAAKAYLEAIIRMMGIEEFECAVNEMKDGCILSLTGADLGCIIGRRGETLDALQYLTGLVANRTDSGYYRVTLDVGNYREKREESLVNLAKRLGSQSARTGRRHSLEPMNPYERRIIHTAVQDIEGITSWSVGTEPNRHVVIGPADDRLHREKGGNGGGRSYGRGNRERSGGNRNRNDRDYQVTAPERPVREFISRSNPLPMADGATPPARTESAKEESASLYGKIEF